MSERPDYFSLDLVTGNHAFGDSEHPSTQTAIEAIQITMHLGAFSPILDMGCGAGLLSMLAAQLWPEARIVAVDKDPDAVRAAQENITNNGFGERITVMRSNGYQAAAIWELAPYDLVISNILADVLIPLAGDLSKILADGGIAILGGIMTWREEEFLAIHAQNHLVPCLPILEVGDWRCYILQKQPPFENP